MTAPQHHDATDPSQNSCVPRRKFLGQVAASGALAGLAIHGGLSRGVEAAEEGADERRIVVGVMGLSRGLALANTFGKLPGVSLKYLCDADTTRTNAAVAKIGKIEGQTPKGIGDFRRILDDEEVDVLICAAPNHWHAPATILGCAHGKHVYVEKPCCHNPQEGEMMVAAARKHNRAVQMGSQRRSGVKIIEGINLLKEGAIGRVYYSRGWYANSRGSIGKGKAIPVPSTLDYELWQGPAPGGLMSITSFTTTGIGAGIGATASWATTGFTLWMSAAGVWGWTIPQGSCLPADGMPSTMTKKPPTPTPSASSSPAKSKLCGKV